MARTTVVYVTADDMFDALTDIENGIEVEWEDEDGNTITLVPVDEIDCE